MPRVAVPSWPSWRPLGRGGVRIAGFTNTVPDVVGPVDGSARLTVFTEGNHYPVLLPLLFDGFVPWCASRPGCRVAADDILVVTLPQYMVVAALRGRRLQLGSLVVPLSPAGVWPDVVMGGQGPLTKLAVDRVVVDRAVVLARHRGLGLLMRRGSPGDVPDLAALVASSARIVMATETEAGARRQYQKTLEAIVGEPSTHALLERAIGDFPGRLAIQHRDVPFALLTDQADAGLIFGHLATFYAGLFPAELVALPVPRASPFGETLLMTWTEKAGAAADFLSEYLLEAAPAAYSAGGFSAPETFDFGAEVPLRGPEKRRLGGSGRPRQKAPPPPWSPLPGDGSRRGHGRARAPWFDRTTLASGRTTHRLGWQAFRRGRRAGHSQGSKRKAERPFSSISLAYRPWSSWTANGQRSLSHSRKRTRTSRSPSSPPSRSSTRQSGRSMKTYTAQAGSSDGSWMAILRTISASSELRSSR